jgi:acetoin utilization deacetylase AcuC-like enzyme
MEFLESMQAFYSDVFELPLPPGHRFPGDKYRLLRQRVSEFAQALDIQLLEAPAAQMGELLLVHTSEYLGKIHEGQLSELEQRRIGFPWSPGMVQRCLHSCGGTVAAARVAWEEGLAVHLAGGTHHAFSDAGQGFCVFNDIAVAARVLLRDTRVQRIAVIDCDVHQGNGTAAIFHEDDRVFTFSMHGDRNFPFRKCDGDLDIALADNTSDEEYLDALRNALNGRLSIAEFDFVFYLAGADPFVEDRLGRLSLTKQGLATRDALVLTACRQAGVPTVVVMAGGYARNLDDIAEIQARTVAFAASQYDGLRSSWFRRLSAIRN